MNFHRNDPILKERRRELRRNQTEAETKLWHHLRNRQMRGLKFFRQYSFGSYILDFYCPTLKLALEVDGGQHNQPSNREYDDARSEYLVAYGVKVIRFWNNDVLRDVQGVILSIEEQIKAITPPNLPLA